MSHLYAIIDLEAADDPLELAKRSLESGCAWLQLRAKNADDATWLEAARTLRYVMPPRPGGTLTLLDTGADVVVGAHQGLEGFAKIQDLWSGALVGKTIHVQITRIPAAEVPTGRRARAQWLYDVWADIDAWIAERVEN